MTHRSDTSAPLLANIQHGHLPASEKSIAYRDLERTLFDFKIP